MNKGYFAIILGAMGLGYGIYCLIKLILVRRWPTAPGRIVRSEKTKRFGGFQTLEDAAIAYEYEVAGKQYTARVIQAGGDMSSTPNKKSETAADKILAKYPLGTEVDVFYNPHFPQMACLERTDATAVFITLIFGPLALGVGFWLLNR